MYAAVLHACSQWSSRQLYKKGRLWRVGFIFLFLALHADPCCSLPDHSIKLSSRSPSASVHLLMVCAV
jgi:hypothetical protein